MTAHDRVVALCRKPSRGGITPSWAPPNSEQIGGELWITDSELRAEVAATDAAIQASWNDVIEQLVKPTGKAIEEGKAAGKSREDVLKGMGIDPSWDIPVVGGPTVSAFQDFVKRWEAWKADNQKMPSLIPLGRGGIWDQVIAFRKEITDWRDKLAAFGVVATTPKPQMPPEHGIPFTKIGLIAGGTLFAIFGLPRLIGSMRRTTGSYAVAAFKRKSRSWRRK